MGSRGSWRSAHQGKRLHRTWWGAWWHTLRVRILFQDRMFPYRCEWGNDHTVKSKVHYHAGHAPGATAQQPRLPPAPRMVRQPSRQMIIGLHPDEMRLLLAGAAAAEVPHPQYAHDLLVAALHGTSVMVVGIECSQ